MIEPCRSADDPDWLALRLQLWPHCSRDQHLAEMSQFLANPHRFVQFMAYETPGQAVGFAEASLRTDPVAGAEGSPVPYLEGLFVVPRARRKGSGRALVSAVEQWALSLGYRELASDALASNSLSHRVHGALGFQECERVVCFRKALR